MKRKKPGAGSWVSFGGELTAPRSPSAMPPGFLTRLRHCLYRVRMEYQRELCGKTKSIGCLVNGPFSAASFIASFVHYAPPVYMAGR